MAKHRYSAVPGTANILFKRMAADEVNTTADMAQEIIELLSGKLNEKDMAQLKRLLMGGEVDEEDVRSNGIEANRAGATDSAASFDRLYPSAKRIKPDPYPGGFR